MLRHSRSTYVGLILFGALILPSRTWKFPLWCLEWVIDKAFGDTIFTYLTAIAAAAVTDTWWIILDWGPRAALMVSAVYLVSRDKRWQFSTAAMAFLCGANILILLKYYDQSGWLSPNKISLVDQKEKIKRFYNRTMEHYNHVNKSGEDTYKKYVSYAFPTKIKEPASADLSQVMAHVDRMRHDKYYRIGLNYIQQQYEMSNNSYELDYIKYYKSKFPEVIAESKLQRPIPGDQVIEDEGIRYRFREFAHKRDALLLFLGNTRDRLSIEIATIDKKIDEQ